MFKQKTNLIKTTILIAVILIITTAFGCKQTTPKTNTNKAKTNTTQNVAINANGSNENIPIVNEAANGTTNEFPVVNANEINVATNQENAVGNENANVNVNANEDINIINENATNETTNEATNEQAGDQELLNLAEKIAEIYGTFTNKDKEPYKNYKALKTYSTSKMQKWLDAQTKEPQDPKAAFYGATTKALTATVLESEDSTSTVLILTKREEITAQSNKPNITYKILKLEFVKENNEWKLNGAYWL